MSRSCHYDRDYMRRILRFLLPIFLLLVSAGAFAQNLHFKWSGEVVPNDPRPGEAAQIVLTLELDKGWHTYQIGQTGGPLALDIKLQPGPAEEIDKIVAPPPLKKFDTAFKIEVGYYENVVKFAIPIRIVENAKGEQVAKIDIKTQVCNEVGCDRPRKQTLEVPFDVSAGEVRVERIAAMTKLPEQPPQIPSSATTATTATEETKGTTEDPPVGGGSLWGIFVAGFIGGLFALLTPCVFPMIPVTISFFAKQGGDRKSQIRAAILYCLGIIVSFTVLGLLVTILLGKNGTYILANNLWVNGGLVLLFVVLALSLFGVFELLIPSGTLTKISGMTQRGGAVAGPLLMGLTFALTSFTCTVPIVGGLLAGAAAGDRLYPALGMIGFSSALALPFLLLALFPSLMKSLPKSGSWMVTAKTFMGFLELAAALKFLSNIDLVLRLGILTRPVFLAIWTAIFLIAGIHLLGWIKLPNDGTSPIGPMRRLFAIGSIAAAWFCLSAMNGASLGTLTGLLPPSDYPFRGKTGSIVEAGKATWIVNDFPKAIAEASSTGKPILIDFTGYT